MRADSGSLAAVVRDGRPGPVIEAGDFKRAFKILDRVGVRVLRDPYTNKPFVSFYTTKRVGGGLDDPQCMKFMRIAAA